MSSHTVSFSSAPFLNLPLDNLEKGSNPDYRLSKIFVASFEGVSSIQDLIKHANSYEEDETVITYPLLEKFGIGTPDTHIECIENKHSPFLRDPNLTLFGGVHLIPYSINEDPTSLRFHLRALLPESAFHFVQSGTGIFGKGFSKIDTDHMREAFKKNNTPFKNGKSCIEGGNAYLFLAEGQKRAIIGETSLYLSLIALEEQGTFDGLVADEEIQPSEDHIRVARNLLEYYREKDGLSGKFQTTEGCSQISAILQAWKQPVSTQIEHAYLAQAKLFATKTRFTEKLIAEEIGIPQENITYVPIKYFHLDMGMTITPEGQVILHDDAEVAPFLNSIEFDDLTTQEQELYSSYQQTAHLHAQEFTKTFRKIETLLKKDGLIVHKMPMVFHEDELEEDGTELNYCNGFFVKNPEQNPKYIFITNGPSSLREKKAHKKFVELFQEKFPNTVIKVVPGMSKIVAKHFGGIHCLSFEDRLICESL